MGGGGGGGGLEGGFVCWVFFASTLWGFGGVCFCFVFGGGFRFFLWGFSIDP